MNRPHCTAGYFGFWLAITHGMTACLTPGKTSANSAESSREGSRGSSTVIPSGTSDKKQASTAACDPKAPIVSLTYDDSLPTQLSVVAPALKAHHLRATFFVTDVRGDKAPWAALKADGHELGAHTLNHPCTRSMSWVQRGKGSEDYDLDRMAKELDANIAELKELGQQPPFSFAYPCGTQWVGVEQTSYVGLVKERFAGARGVIGGVVTRLADAYDVPSSFLSGTGSELVQVVDRAKSEKGWVVLGFHGVGGDSNPTAADAHEKLLTYLEKQSDAVQVLTFGEALKCVLAK